MAEPISFRIESELLRELEAFATALGTDRSNAARLLVIHGLSDRPSVLRGLVNAYARGGRRG